MSAVLTTIATYDMTAPRQATIAAMQAISDRSKLGSVAGVRTYRLYLHPSEPRAAAIITYADGQACVDHHDFILPSPEFAALRDTVRLSTFDIVGTLGAARDWLAGLDLLDRHRGDSIADLDRPNDVPVEHTLLQTMRYTYEADSDAFAAATAALVERVSREGLPGVLRYVFAHRPAHKAAAGLVAYDAAQTFSDHHTLVAEWPEYVTFKGMLKLTDLGIYGALGDLGPGLEKMGLAPAYRGALVAGFRR